MPRDSVSGSVGYIGEAGGRAAGGILRLVLDGIRWY